MQTSSNKKLPLYLVFPIVFCLAYLLANPGFFSQPYQETGDYAANALQIWKAGMLEETLGAYSRFLVNHPGPIVFYYLALAEKIFFFVKSPHGAHSIGIVLYNLFFLLIGLRILYSKLEENRSTVLLFASLVLGLTPLLPNAFSNIWGPGVVLLPTLVLILSLADFSQGSIRNFFWFVVCSNIIVQNQIVGISFIIPMFAVGCFYFYKSLSQKGQALEARSQVLKDNLSFETDYKNKGLSQYKTKEFGLNILFALAFTIICWTPPLIEQFTNSPGNLSKIIGLALKNSTFHKLGPTLQYVLSYYVSPLSIPKQIPALLAVGLLFGIPSFWKNKLQEFDRSLLKTLIWAFFITLFGAFKMKGGQISHIYWFTYVLAGLLYYLNLKIILSKFEFPNTRSFQIYSISIIFLCIAIYGKNTEFEYDDRPEKFVTAISPQKGTKYRIRWKSDPKDFGQGDLSLGILLRLTREGYNSCLNEEWHFLVPKSFRCSDSESAITITLETPEKESEEFQILNRNSFHYKSTIVRIIE
ncbi:hypothetical protein [Leptospira johnsonii]|uniref:Glycosyltransferase RgtA/B/C/D-like domain-containing protein n=1 Tax=Leptospira johnsonii TaxID=1917820 RepID=A0A2P2D699_9LEPT|nr:hypothetical protein [Leptospira johnsonii]GBF40091.1 hypothetical protein LPTSP1_31020 [Leptospira johnsonii]